VDVKKVKVDRVESLVTKPNVVSNNRVKQLAMAVSDRGYKIEVVYKPWYTNWVGWTLGGAGLIVGGVMWSDYEAKIEEVECTAEPPACKSFNERVNIAADAQTTRTLAGVFFGAGSLFVAGSVVAFILMKEEDFEAGGDVDVGMPRLRSITPLVGRDTTGLGATFSF
jgi:hypothetical protein